MQGLLHGLAGAALSICTSASHCLVTGDDHAGFKDSWIFTVRLWNDFVHAVGNRCLAECAAIGQPQVVARVSICMLLPFVHTSLWVGRLAGFGCELLKSGLAGLV